MRLRCSFIKTGSVLEAFVFVVSLKGNTFGWQEFSISFLNPHPSACTATVSDLDRRNRCDACVVHCTKEPFTLQWYSNTAERLRQNWAFSPSPAVMPSLHHYSYTFHYTMSVREVHKHRVLTDPLSHTWMGKLFSATSCFETLLLGSGFECVAHYSMFSLFLNTTGQFVSSSKIPRTISIIKLLIYSIYCI